MSKKRVIQRKAERAILNATPQVKSTRSAFTIALTFDPAARPQTANVNVMPLGGDGTGGAHIDDVVTALRMGYEQAVMQKGAWLLQQQQMAARDQAEQGESAPAT